MRILVADISAPDRVNPPVAEFLGVEPHLPPPKLLIWRGHEVLIRPGISFEEALALEPDFVMGLMGWGGIGPERSKFYEKFFDLGIPVFTWGNDSCIPKLMARVEMVRRCRAPSKRIVFAKPEHPILANLSPEEIRTSGCDARTLVKSVRKGIGLAYDPDNGSWEILYLEEWFGNRRWLHYHPYPCPPKKLVDNMLAYMTRPKSKAPLLLAGIGVGALLATIAIAKQK